MVAAAAVTLRVAAAVVVDLATLVNSARYWVPLSPAAVVKGSGGSILTDFLVLVIVALWCRFEKPPLARMSSQSGRHPDPRLRNSSSRRPAGAGDGAGCL